MNKDLIWLVENEREWFDCGHAGAKLRVDPYLIEIEQITIYRLLCDKCYDTVAEEI
jgi:hypothetical protein